MPWLPVLLALSANSPFVDCGDTGRRSARAERLLAMPTGGTPPLVLRRWDDWRTATGGDSTRRHWDAWPRPEYGTLEVRVMDMQTDVRRVGRLRGDRACPRLETPGTVETYDRELYARRREEASRLPPDPAEVEALAAQIEPALDGEEPSSPASFSRAGPRPSASSSRSRDRRRRAGRGRADVRLVSAMAIQTETIQVSGVRCERCVVRLGATLRGLDGLEAANANLIGEVTLSWDDDRSAARRSSRGSPTTASASPFGLVPLDRPPNGGISLLPGSLAVLRNPLLGWAG